ncbi:hypothetical protein Ciccas_014065, partial [Cichlidogyrus casuarinus]
MLAVLISLAILRTDAEDCLADLSKKNAEIVLGCWAQPPFLDMEEEKNSGALEGVMWSHTRSLLDHCCPSQRVIEKCDHWYQNELDARVSHKISSSILIGYTKISQEVLDTHFLDDHRVVDATDFISLVVSP